MFNIRRYINLALKEVPQKQTGSSLIEVLVTIVVLSLGVLSIGGLIVTTVKYGHGSYGRSQANWLANDIIDRMRANRATAEAPPYPYNLAMGDATPSPANIVQQDLARWRAQVANTLPTGNASVRIDAGTLKVTVVIEWADTISSGNPPRQTLTVETLL
jgi:type IV pilus assembly protein PilV